MKDFSLFLFKNYLTAKMRKSFKSFCNGDCSTSTLNQQQTITEPQSLTDYSSSSPYLLTEDKERSQPTTLEEMILQLDLEEKMARRAKAVEYGEIKHRMSCVNSSDILRSARNALNQYPRFSLDGKDAMYRSSFRNFDCGPAAVNASTGGRKSICRNSGVGPKNGFCNTHSSCIDSQVDQMGRRSMPAKVGGENVVWCKPGVVGKLMGLEAMPIPVLNSTHCCRKEILMKKHNLTRKRGDEMEERRGGGVVEAIGGCGGLMMGKRASFGGSCSSNTAGGGGYCIMRPPPPVSPMEKVPIDEVGWPMLRFM